MARHGGERPQSQRLEAFGLTAADIALLREHGTGFAAERLPGLLEELHASFDQWPEIRDTLRIPAVHAVRLRHWSLAASGRIEDGFVESARALATAFYAHGVPGYAVAICHFSVCMARRFTSS